MKNGVRIEVDSEDIAIETKILDWQDKERQLFAGTGEPVEILRSDGTSFTGWGFSADARRRTWSFTDGVQGIYIDDDDDDEEEGEPGEEGEPDESGETAEAGETPVAETATVSGAPPAASGPDRPAAERPDAVPAASGAAPAASQDGVTNEAVEETAK
jgi:hypothetical protein